jgi:preprotein translocase subunit YajC
MLNFLYQSAVLFSERTFAQVSAEPNAVATAAAQQAPQWMQFVPFAVIIGVFYFFLIRPQAKKQKETQNFLSTLKVGEQVVTQSGILGRISALTDQIVTLEIAHDVQIKVMRSMVMMSQVGLQPKKEVK